jgi:hypothetical protein
MWCCEGGDCFCGQLSVRSTLIWGLIALEIDRVHVVIRWGTEDGRDFQNVGYAAETGNISLHRRSK